MSAWLTRLRETLARGERCVLVTVAGTRGSTPREIGAKMLVGAHETVGTVGGGQLEYQCVRRALAWLGPGADDAGAGRCRLERFVLGANCGQCCGGVAEMLFEEMTAADGSWVDALAALHDGGTAAIVMTARQSGGRVAKLIVTTDTAIAAGLAPTPAALALARRALAGGDKRAQIAALALGERAEQSVLLEAVRPRSLHIAIFGAGHVGSACARVLSALDAQVDLIDSRSALLDGRHPATVRCVDAAAPSAVVATLPAGCFYLVMTHDHGLDLELCARILERGDARFCGLIGSRSKRRRFDKRLRALGLSETAIAGLTCPLGDGDIRSKEPAHIAIAVAAQLVRVCERGAASAVSRRRGKA